MARALHNELVDLDTHWAKNYVSYRHLEVGCNKQQVSQMCQCAGVCGGGCSVWPKWNHVRPCWANQETKKEKEKYWGYQKAYLCKFCRQRFEEKEQKKAKSSRTNSRRWVPSGDHDQADKAEKASKAETFDIASSDKADMGSSLGSSGNKEWAILAAVADKADKADINTLIADKADKAQLVASMGEISTAIADKADKADMKTLIADKADKTQLVALMGEFSTLVADKQARKSYGSCRKSFRTMKSELQRRLRDLRCACGPWNSIASASHQLMQ